MRIISGELRGRRLNPPTSIPVRPTTDLAKESLFNILRSRVGFAQCSVLDLFCGTGGISFEFVSRGAKSVTSVDINSRCVAFINQMKEKFSVNNLFVIRSDAFAYMSRSRMKFDVVFADPPYEMDKFDMVPRMLFDKDLLKDDGLFILEHSKEHSYEEHPYFIEQRHYGKVNFSFFKKNSAPLTE